MSAATNVRPSSNGATPIDGSRAHDVLGSDRASVPPGRIRHGLLFQPREMVLGRPPQQRHRRQSDEGPASGSRANLTNDRKGRRRSPEISKRVVCRKSRRAKALCLDKDWYSKLIGPPGPKAEVDEHARQGRPRPRREQGVPLRVASLRGEADPHRDTRPPECAGKPESELRLQNESNATRQLEAVVSRGQDRSRRGPWSPCSYRLLSARHACHLTRP